MPTMATHNSPLPGPHDLKPDFDPAENGPGSAASAGRSAALPEPMSRAQSATSWHGDEDRFEHEGAARVPYVPYLEGLTSQQRSLETLLRCSGARLSRQENLLSTLVESDQSMQTWSSWLNRGMALGTVSLAIGFGLMFLAPPAVSAIGFVIGVAGVGVLFVSGMFRSLVAFNNVNIQRHAQAESVVARHLREHDVHHVEVQRQLDRIRLERETLLMRHEEATAAAQQERELAARGSATAPTSQPDPSHEVAQPPPASADADERKGDERKIQDETPELTQPLLSSSATQSDLN